MSPDFERVIGRAIVDKEFRKQLLDDPDAALGSEFSLTDDELKALKKAVKEAAKRRKKDDIDEQMEALRGGAWS